LHLSYFSDFIGEGFSALQPVTEAVPPVIMADAVMNGGDTIIAGQTEEVKPLVKIHTFSGTL